MRRTEKKRVSPEVFASYWKRTDAWLERIRRCRGIPDGCFKAAHYLATKGNYETLDCWPTLATIAREIGKEERQTQNLISRLIAEGFIARKRGGRGNPSVYILRLDEAQNTAHQKGDDVQNIACDPERSARLDTQFSVPMTRKELPTNSSREHHKGNSPSQGAVSSIYDEYGTLDKHVSYDELNNALVVISFVHNVSLEICDQIERLHQVRGITRRMLNIIREKAHAGTLTEQIVDRTIAGDAHARRA